MTFAFNALEFWSLIPLDLEDGREELEVEFSLATAWQLERSSFEWLSGSYVRCISPSSTRSSLRAVGKYHFYYPRLVSLQNHLCFSHLRRIMINRGRCYYITVFEVALRLRHLSVGSRVNPLFYGLHMLWRCSHRSPEQFML